MANNISKTKNNANNKDIWPMRYPEIENTAEGIPLIYRLRIVKI